MSNVVPYPSGQSGGGSGPEDPMLEKRVATLEGDMKDVKASLSRLELASAEIKGMISQMPKASDLAPLQKDVSEIKGRLDGLDKRFAAIPTTWQTIAILAALLFGIAGVLFAFGRYLKP